MKYITGFEDYGMDPSGRVWSFKRDEPREMAVSADGRVKLWRKGECYKFLVRKLFLDTFHPVEMPHECNYDFLEQLIWDYGRSEDKNIIEFLKQMRVKLSEPTEQSIRKALK